MRMGGNYYNKVHLSHYTITEFAVLFSKLNILAAIGLIHAHM